MSDVQVERSGDLNEFVTPRKMRLSADPFSPAAPPIALQSFTRDAPFCNLTNDPSELACFSFPREVDRPMPATCEGCSAVAFAVGS